MASVPFPIGTRFGKFTIAGAPFSLGSGKTTRTFYPVKCDCGNPRTVNRSTLVNGASKSCGCTRDGHPSPDFPEGTRFNRLITIGASFFKIHSGAKVKYYRCLCDCGTQADVRRASLISGITKSCGCLKIECAFTNHYKHGHTHVGHKTKLYSVWASLVQRCHNPKNKDFHYYGGRGIAVCDEWRNSSSAFIEWAEANGYEEGLQIDRQKNDLGYSPDNCRWVTSSINCLNRRSRWRNKSED